jgi:hypothetical protein
MKISRFRIGVVSVVTLICLSLAALAFAATTKATIKATRVNSHHAAVDITVTPLKCGANQSVKLYRTGWKNAKTVQLNSAGKFSHTYYVPKKTVTFTVNYAKRRVGHHPHFTTCSHDSASDSD